MSRSPRPYPRPSLILWGCDRFSALGAALMIAAVLILIHTAYAQPPTPDDLQRQIHRLSADLDRLEAEVKQEQVDNARIRLDGFSRLAALEREVTLNRNIVWGVVAGLLGNFFVGIRAVQVGNRAIKVLNGAANEARG